MEKPSKSRGKGKSRGRGQNTRGGTPGPTRPDFQASVPPATSSWDPSRAHDRSGERSEGFQTQQTGTDTLPRAMGAMGLTGRITDESTMENPSNSRARGRYRGRAQTPWGRTPGPTSLVSQPIASVPPIPSCWGPPRAYTWRDESPRGLQTQQIGTDSLPRTMDAMGQTGRITGESTVESPSYSRARGRDRRRTQTTRGGTPRPTRPVSPVIASVPSAPSSWGPSKAHVTSSESSRDLQTQQIGKDTPARAMGAMEVTGGITDERSTMENPANSRARGRARGRAQTSRGRTRGPIRPDSQALASVSITPSSSKGSSRSHVRSGEDPGDLQTQQIGTDTLPRALGAMKLTGRITGDDSGNAGAIADPGTTHKETPKIREILHTRPSKIKSKTGTSGSPTDFLCNYYVLEKNKEFILCLYHVEFSIPDEKLTTTLKRELLMQHHDKIGERFVLGGKQLWCTKRLPDGLELDSRNEATNEWIKIKLGRAGELYPSNIQFMQVLNIILNRCQEYLEYKMCDSNYYNVNSSLKVFYKGEEISVWPGFITSVRQFEEKIMLNVDVTHKFVRKETLLHAIKKAQESFRNEEVSKKFSGCNVRTIYNSKIYRVHSIDFGLSPKDKFKYGEKDQTFKQYYKEKYVIDIKDDTQPLACSKGKRKDIKRGMAEVIYLIPELCTLTGVSEEMRKDNDLMRQLAKYMRVSPGQRIEALRKFNTSLINNRKVEEELEHWGLKLQQDLVKVKGRILDPQKISLRNQTLDNKEQDWSGYMRETKLNQRIKLENWACVFPGHFQSDAYGFVRILRDVSERMDFIIGNADMIEAKNDKIEQYIEALTMCAGKQMVVLLLPNNNQDRYGAIKRILSVNMAIPSQCILINTVRKRQIMSIATKVVIQMNCKLGGVIWRIEKPLKDTMLIGYDAYHDTQSRGASYGAVVSSINQQWTKYYGQVDKHENKTELTNHFCANVKQAVSYYRDVNNCLPKSVFVFRDGVGEGQIGHVYNKEVAEIKKCFKKIGKSNIKLTFVIVSKRINTRIFPSRGKSTENPPPGTVVDSVITLPERYDFYLIPQKVSQGTVTPTSYNVIHDESELPPDEMQTLAFKLTHLYYNWPGTIRVPAPCMYAHKLAYITGTAIHAEANPTLAEKLWYL